MGKETRAKIEREIAEGKLGIARDRLQGLVHTFPDDMALRSRLGDVYMKLGYPAEAGRYWFLDKDLTDEKRDAIDLFIIRCQKDPSLVLKRLKLRCSPNDLSTAHARALVEELIEDCKKRNYQVPTFAPSRNFSPQRRIWWTAFGCQAAAFVFLTLAAVGFFTILKAIFKW